MALLQRRVPALESEFLDDSPSPSADGWILAASAFPLLVVAGIFVACRLTWDERLPAVDTIAFELPGVQISSEIPSQPTPSLPEQHLPDEADAASSIKPGEVAKAEAASEVNPSALASISP